MTKIKVGDIYYCRCTDKKHMFRVLKIYSATVYVSSMLRIKNIEGHVHEDSTELLGDFACSPTKNKIKYVSLLFKYPEMFR